VFLDFWFPFYGVWYNSVYLSADGAVLLRALPSAACAAQGMFQLFAQAAASNSATPCQYVGVAGSVTDYDPSSVASGSGTRIDYVSNELLFSVRYTQMPLAADSSGGAAAMAAAQAVRHTFQISLFPNGRVITSYPQIDDPAQYGAWAPAPTRKWAVGLLLHTPPLALTPDPNAPAPFPTPNPTVTSDGYILEAFGGADSAEAEFIANASYPFVSRAAPRYALARRDRLSRGVYPSRALLTVDRTIQWCSFGRMQPAHFAQHIRSFDSLTRFLSCWC
jgi:hypothetical protein